MNRTTAHVVASLAWLFGAPLIFVPLFVSGALPSLPVASLATSAVWALGFIAVFGSWALTDAPEHGKTKTLALAFTAAWVVFPVLAVFPYLFATRGLHPGTIASLKFLSVCIACAIVWLGAPRILALFT